MAFPGAMNLHLYNNDAQTLPIVVVFDGPQAHLPREELRLLPEDIMRGDVEVWFQLRVRGSRCLWSRRRYVCMMLFVSCTMKDKARTTTEIWLPEVPRVRIDRSFR